MAEIISLIKPTTEAVKQVSSVVNPDQKKEIGFMDIVDGATKLFDRIDSIMGKVESIKGTFEKIAEKKGVFNQAPPQQRQDNHMASENPPIDVKSRPVPDAPQQQTPTANAGANEMNEAFIDQYFDNLLVALKEKVPEDYKKKTLAELVEEYEKSGNFKQSIIRSMVKDEIRQIVIGANSK